MFDVANSLGSLSEGTEAIQGCLSDVLDQLDTGVLVCDANGHVVLDNEAARRELAHGHVLERDERGGLQVDGRPHLPLRIAIRNAALQGRWQLVAVNAESESQAATHRLMVAVQPLRSHQPLLHPFAVLLLGRRSLCPVLAVPMLARLYALTPAEQNVLLSLLSGQTVEALAQARSVAVSTVRSQVASLRTKFGVRRLNDITRLVAELPPMMSVLHHSGQAMGV